MHQKYFFTIIMVLSGKVISVWKLKQNAVILPQTTDPPDRWIQKVTHKQ